MSVSTGRRMLASLGIASSIKGIRGFHGIHSLSLHWRNTHNSVYQCNARRRNVARPSLAAYQDQVCRFSTRNIATTTPGYTTSFAFFEALWESGVQACFVNLGSDHPSLIEAMLKGQRERRDRFPKIYTCPSEMVALSMADGWARVTGQPQAVIVHVDVGTQALGCGIHNASAGRCPVLIFAGLCPVTDDGLAPGSRTEYQHWVQDAPDQKAIVRQYCRYVGEISAGRTVKQTVARALQFATSDPKGPVYLAGSREVMAEKIKPYSLDKAKCVSIGPAALPSGAVTTIVESLLRAERPLIITGYSGRNHRCPPLLMHIADLIPGLRVFDTGGSEMCFPMTHPASLGFRFSVDESTTDADVILILDCDVPWIPSRNSPREETVIYHIDVDPLNAMMLNSFFPAHGRWKADSYTALSQLKECLERSPSRRDVFDTFIGAQRRHCLEKSHAARISSFAELTVPRPNNSLTASHVGALVKASVPLDTTFVIEVVTSAVQIADQLQTSIPGSWINCGGAGLGWGGGACLGVKLALETSGRPSFVCAIVGDGTFLFSFPGSVFWVAARYGIPILMVVLNNKGWNAPRKSLELVHPNGLAKVSSNQDINIAFDPSPEYGGIAKAAAGERFGQCQQGLYTTKADNTEQLRDGLRHAVQAVKAGRGAVVEAVLERDDIKGA